MTALVCPSCRMRFSAGTDMAVNDAGEFLFKRGRWYVHRGAPEGYRGSCADWERDRVDAVLREKFPDGDSR